MKIVARLESILKEMPSGASTQRTSDLQVLVKLTVVGATTIVEHLRTLTENYLAVCRAPEAAENGLRLDALGNLISITVLRTPAEGNENVVGLSKQALAKLKGALETITEHQEAAQGKLV